MEFGFASRFFWTVTIAVTVNVRYDPLVIDIDSVPEPATMTLLGLSLAGWHQWRCLRPAATQRTRQSPDSPRR